MRPPSRFQHLRDDRPIGPPDVTKHRLAASGSPFGRLDHGRHGAVDIRVDHDEQHVLACRQKSLCDIEGQDAAEREAHHPVGAARLNFFDRGDIGRCQDSECGIGDDRLFERSGHEPVDRLVRRQEAGEAGVVERAI